MYRWFLAGAVVLLAAALACVTMTLIRMARGDFGIGDSGFWQMVAFHPIAALLGALLLEQAVRGMKATGPAAESADDQQREAES